MHCFLFVPPRSLLCGNFVALHASVVPPTTPSIGPEFIHGRDSIHSAFSFRALPNPSSILFVILIFHIFDVCKIQEKDLNVVHSINLLLAGSIGCFFLYRVLYQSAGYHSSKALSTASSFRTVFIFGSAHYGFVGKYVRPDNFHSVKVSTVRSRMMVGDKCEMHHDAFLLDNAGAFSL